MVDIMTEGASKVLLRDLVKKLIPEALGKEIEKQTQSIYPLKDCCIRKVLSKGRGSLLGGRFGSFLFFSVRWRGKEGGMSVGRGGGAIYFCSGPKFPPSLLLTVGALLLTAEHSF